jgi:hypothetical protein
MKPTSEELADVILTLGEEEELTGDVRQEVLDKLVEMGMIHVEMDSPPVLTEHGQKTYSKMIDGSDVPELEFDWPDED